MKLAAWARANGVHPQTAYRWFRQGTMPVPARRLPSGTILVEVPGSDHDGGRLDQRAVLYARVSAHDQRGELDRQVTRLSGWATAHGVTVAEVVTEVGSGLNGRRPKLRRVLADPRAAMIVVSTGIGWPASASSTWRRRCPRRAGGWWWSTLGRPATT